MKQPSTKFDVNSIPEELKKRKQWVLWKPVNREGKWTKMPFQTVSPVLPPASANVQIV